MKYKKTLPYKLKLTAAIGLPLLLGACQEKQEPEPTHDALVEFDISNFDEKLDVNYVKQVLQDKNIRYLYLSPQKHWTGWEVPHILFLRNAGLQKCLDISPKVRGRGNFDFKPGEASKIPEDSLWFVKNGWTINKNNQR